MLTCPGVIRPDHWRCVHGAARCAGLVVLEHVYGTKINKSPVYGGLKYDRRSGGLRG